MKEFDLIYVPAETYMLKTGIDDTVQSFIKLNKPASVILLEDMGQKVKVLHENKNWLIEKKHLRGLHD
tara:strand:- start:3116 stop:3319 length:204 start_codon:yes stop_codon:yes gene_type:complete